MMETATEAPIAPMEDLTIEAPSLETSKSQSFDEVNSSETSGVASDNKNGNKPGQKDRKNRRPGLPLPDPIPEEPVKAYPAPDKEELQKKLDEENNKMQECYARLSKTRQFMDERQKIRDSTKPAFDAARKELGQLNNECRAMFEERKALSARIKELREMATSGANKVFNELTGAGKDGTEALKDVNNMQDLEARIREYQYRLETESMPIIEEKKIVAKISFLTHKGRDFIQQRDLSTKNAKAENDARKASRAELEQKRAALDVRIDATKEKMEEKKKELDEIRAKQVEEEKKLTDSTPEVNRDDERKKITEIRAAMRKMRDDFQDELDKWYLNRRIIAEQQKIAKRKKYEALQAVREEKRKAWEAEQAQYPEPHPYQAEKDMCSGLTVYLKTLLGETIEKPAINLRGENGAAGVAPSLKANGGATREITVAGTKVGKSARGMTDGFEDLAFSDFVKPKKGRKGRKSGSLTHSSSGADSAANVSSGAQGADEESALKPHSIDYLTAFSKLGIKPPNRLSEVRAALDAVIAKAAFYETAPAPTEEEKEEAAKKNNADSGNKSGAGKKKGGSKGEGNGNVDIVNGDASSAFPGLGSTGTDASSRARSNDSMPSFKAVASGDAHAPAAAADAPSMIVDPTPGEAAAVANDNAGQNGATPADAVQTDLAEGEMRENGVAEDATGVADSNENGDSGAGAAEDGTDSKDNDNQA